MNERALELTSPFIYSVECRDAVLTDFILIIIKSSTYQAFLSPLVYFFLSNNQKDLKAQMVLFNGLNVDALKNMYL